MIQGPTTTVVARKGDNLVLLRSPEGQFVLLDRESQEARKIRNPHSVLKTGYWEILEPAALQTANMQPSTPNAH